MGMWLLIVTLQSGALSVKLGNQAHNKQDLQSVYYVH